MAEQLFTTELGYKIEDEAGNSVDLILVDGLPGGTTESDNAPVGSFALSTNGSHYRKHTAGSGGANWEDVGSSQAVTDAQNEIDAIETSLGAFIDNNGDFVPNPGLNVLGSATDYTSALIALDNFATGNSNEIDAIESALGSMVDGNGDYVAHTGTSYIDGNTNVTEDLTDLDAAISAVDSDKLSRTGDVMDAGADLVFSGGGEVKGLPGVPTAVHSAVSKAYVDSLATESKVWVAPVSSPDLVGIAATEPGAPIASGMYIAYNDGAGTGFPQTWGTETVNEYDMLHFAGGLWQNIGSIDSATPTRIGVGLNCASVDGTLPAGMLQEDLVEYIGGVGGDPTAATSWQYPHGRVGGVTRSVTSVDQGDDKFTMVGDFTDEFFPNNKLVYVGGTPSTNDGEYTITGVAFVGGNTEVTVLEDVSVASTGGTAEPELRDGLSCYDNNPSDSHYGTSYLYSRLSNDWIEVSGASQVGAGVGLEYSGTTLNINLGAGIAESPSDEVGLDLHANGGLITTNDGTTPDSGTASQLAIKLADSSLTLGAGGLSVSTSITTEIDNIEAALGAMVDATGAYVAHSGTFFIDGNTDITADLIDLDTAIGNVDAVASANELDIVNLQQELDDTQIGAGLGTSGSYTPDAGSNYLKSADFTGAGLTENLFNADQLLDAQIKANADAITALQAGSTEDTHIRAFIGKNAAGSEFPVYSSAFNLTGSDIDLENAIGQLDAAIGNNTGGIWSSDTETVWGFIHDKVEKLLFNAHAPVIDAASGTTWATVDAVPADIAVMAKWLVHVRQGQNVITWEVDAVHNGGAGNTPAATQVDFTRFAKLRIGTIAGVKVRVELAGGVMLLQVQDTAGTAVVNAVREIVADSAGVGSIPYAV